MDSATDTVAKTPFPFHIARKRVGDILFNSPHPPFMGHLGSRPTTHVYKQKTYNDRAKLSHQTNYSYQYSPNFMGSRFPVWVWPPAPVESRPRMHDGPPSPREERSPNDQSTMRADLNLTFPLQLHCNRWKIFLQHGGLLEQVMPAPTHPSHGGTLHGGQGVGGYPRRAGGWGPRHPPTVPFNIHMFKGLKACNIGFVQLSLCQIQSFIPQRNVAA